MSYECVKLKETDMADIREKNVKSVSGIPMLLLLIGIIILGVFLLVFFV